MSYPSAQNQSLVAVLTFRVWCTDWKRNDKNYHSISIPTEIINKRLPAYVEL